MVDPVEAVRLALPPEQDEEPRVAEAPAFVGKFSQPRPNLRLRRPPGAIPDYLVVGGNEGTGSTLDHWKYTRAADPVDNS